MSATRMFKSVTEQLGKDAEKLKMETANMINQAKNGLNVLRHINKSGKSPQDTPDDDR